MKPTKPATPRPTGSDLAVFLGGAILVVGTVLALDYTNILLLDGEAFTAALAAGLVVLGVGIAVLGIRGRSSGFLGFAAAVGIVFALISGATVGTGNWVFANQGQWAGDNTRAAMEGYTVVAGQGTIDLRGLDNLTEDVTVPVITAAGNVGILVPDDVPVDIRTQLAASATDVVSPGDSTSAGGLWQPGGLSLNGDAEGPAIILEIRGLASHVTIATSVNGLTEQGIRLQP